VSVGAVYNANGGGLTWGASPNQCTDSPIAADEVACFSMFSTYLTMLAPGALINAGGSVKGGTSMAAPHVAGALAVLRSAFGSETLARAESRLTANGTSIEDSRIGQPFPRLNLPASARPPNDDFADAVALTDPRVAAALCSHCRSLRSKAAGLRGKPRLSLSKKKSSNCHPFICCQRQRRSCAILR
jgi:subtilisin family serine protease